MKGMKKSISVLLCMAMISGIIWFPVGANASESNAQVFNAKSYGAWKDQTVLNGDFEVGMTGMDVYGWSLIPTDINKGEIENLDSYKNNFYLKVAEEQNGNKVAEFAKFASGYMAMVSQEIDVTASEDYYLSIDYYLKDISIDIDTATGEPATSGNQIFPLSFFIEEIDVNGNAQRKEGSSNRIQDENYEEASSEWSTFHLQFQTASSTKRVRIYCWLGGQWNVNETVWIDNVTLSKRSDGEVINGDFESSRVGNSIRGWTKIGLKDGNNTGYFDTENSWGDNYTMQTMKYGDSRVAALSKVGGGYGALKSDLIPVKAEKTYRFEADWMVRDVVATDNGFNGVHFQILQKDASGVESILYQSQRLNPEDINKNNPNMTNWSHVNFTFTTTAGAESVRVIYLNHATWGATNTALLDNVTVTPQDVDGVDGWTKETCEYPAKPRDDASDFTKNYGFVEINGGVGYENAFQLYVKRDGGILGGTVVYSEPIPIEGGKAYTTSFDMKIEGYNSTEESGFFDKRLALRYLTDDGTQINGTNPDTYVSRRGDHDWTNYTQNVTTPENAAYVQIGFVIGSSKMNTQKNLKYGFANIAFAKTDDTAYWSDYAKRKETDLFFALLDHTNDATVQNLVAIKKKINNNEYDNLLDMNKSGRINNDDLVLIRWKLVGFTKWGDLQ